jgi:hypothetical protein
MTFLADQNGPRPVCAGWMPPRLVAASILALAIAWGAYLVWLVHVDPKVVFLAPDACAEWLVANDPVDPGIHEAGFYMNHFRTWVDAGPPRDALLTLRALRIAEVSLDGRLVYRTTGDMSAWKQPHPVPLHIGAGDDRHELLITVVNENGPPAFLACAPEIGIASGPGWESRLSHDTTWAPALLAEPRLPRISRRFPRADQALFAIWPALLGVLIVAAAVTVAAERAPVRWRARIGLSPSTFRWLLIGAWGVLAANNIYKLPLYVGFDVVPHLDYIKYLVEHWRIPLATEGWQMFQPPLYHALSALLVWMPARPFLNEDATVHLLRVVPLACGVAQVELAYRAVRHVFPHRADLQRLGTLLGGLLPINLYASQYLGNEPLTGCLVAAAIVLLLRWLRAPEAVLDVRSHWLLGCLLGLALLAKPTAVLVVVPALLVLARAHALAGQRPVAFLHAGTRVLIALAVVAGWYYARNWVWLGAPFVGGWDPSRGIGWWQDPGYRVAAHFYSFGEALRFPLYGGLGGLWDAEYSSFWLDGWLSAIMRYDLRPPWNYALMLPAPWLAVVPAAAMLVGMVSGPWQPEAIRRGLVLATGLIALYLTATLSLYLQVPIYAAAKATQLLGLTPCFAVLGAAGYELLGRARVVRPALYGATACWALCAYFAYFIR